MENIDFTAEKENEIEQLLSSLHKELFEDHFRKAINLCDQILGFDPYNEIA